jgi:hypothetical protein
LNAILRRHPRAAWAVTVLAAVLSGVLVVACLSLSTGCGSAAQRTVSAMAVAAVAADDANATAYELIALQAVKDARDAGEGFPGWCRRMQAPWDRSCRASCAIEALADLALAGQALVDASKDLGPEWFAAACGVLAALDDAWSANGDVPQVVEQARSLVCGLSGGSEDDPPTCHDPGPPPPCEEVP